ncbi:shikimate kinase [Synechocystis sp. LKSZ1]|uniref:shikimate kinase n=1 Tax=Synechocystis sp. LKSZ1 TaxID=3144951 RepID=UPI00336C1B5B
MLNQLQGLNVFLIGMMGSGKTTVGQALAAVLGYRFFDADVLLERVAQRSISEIFATEGEAAFRDWESQILGELSACTRSVIATGGGVVLRPANWGLLRHGVIVWLEAPLGLLVERLQADQTRPLLQATELSGRLSQLLQERQHLYAEADLRIPISAEESPQAIALKIVDQLPTVLKNPGPLTPADNGHSAP